MCYLVNEWSHYLIICCVQYEYHMNCMQTFENGKRVHAHNVQLYTYSHTYTAYNHVYAVLACM